MTSTKQHIHMVLTAQDLVQGRNDRAIVAENLREMELQKSIKTSCLYRATWKYRIFLT